MTVEEQEELCDAVVVGRGNRVELQWFIDVSVGEGDRDGSRGRLEPFRLLSGSSTASANPTGTSDVLTAGGIEEVLYIKIVSHSHV